MKKSIFVSLALMLNAVMGYAQEFTFEIISTEDRTAAVTGGSDLSDEVEIPSTCTIGEIDYSVVAISARAFTRSNDVTKFVIPSSVTTIGDFAFSYCRRLSDITIPSSVTTIGLNPFGKSGNYSSQLSSIEVEEGSAYFKSVDGVLYSADGTILYVFPSDKYLTTFNVPEDVVTVKPYAFMGIDDLGYVYFPDATQTIGEGAFIGCGSLQHFYFGTGIKEIQPRQFLYDMDDSQYCTTLQGMHFTSKTSAPYIVGLFTDGVMPETKLYIPLAKHATYANSTQLVSGDTPSATGWADVMSRVVEEGYADTDDNEVPLFYHSIENATTGAPEDGVVAVATNPDDQYRGAVSIPSSISVDGVSCSVVQIEESAFSGCDDLLSINIPASVVCIQDNGITFNKKLKSISVDEGSARYADVDGVLYTSGLDTLVAYPSAYPSESFTTPETVSVISYGAINETSKLISFSTNAKEIDRENFLDCKNLQHIYYTNTELSILRMRCPGEYVCVHLFGTTIPDYSGMDGLTNCYLIVDEAVRETFKESDFGSMFEAVLSLTESASFNDNTFDARAEAAYVASLSVNLNFSNIKPRTSYLPFSIPVSALNENRIAVYAIDRCYKDDGAVIVFKRIMNGVTPLNKPLILVSEVAEDISFTLSNVLLTEDLEDDMYYRNIENLSPEDYSYGIQFIAITPAVSASDIAGNYSIGNGALGKISASTTLNPYRWYISLWGDYESSGGSSEPGGMGVGSLRFQLDGKDSESTVLESVSAKEDFSFPMYNLNGQRVDHPNQPGLYIQGSKKMFVQ